MRIDWSLVVIALLIGLAPQAGKAESFPSPPPFSAVGLEKYARPGTCQLIGRALVNTKTFGPLIFAHQKANLLPLTDYSVWYVKRLADMTDTRPMHYPDELVRFNRSTITDANGSFSFDNIPCGSYILEMFTDYESDSHSIENRTVYSTNEDEYPTSITTQHVHTKIRRELDVVAVTSFFTHEDEQMTGSSFTILGFQQCCGGEL